MRVFSAHFALDLDAKTVELLAKKMAQGSSGFIQVKPKKCFLSIFGAKHGEQSVSTMHF